MTRQLTTSQPMLWSLGSGALAAAVAAGVIAALGLGSLAIVASAIAAAIVVALVVGFVWPRLLGRHRVVDAVERAFGAPVLINLPRVASAKQAPPIMLTEVGTEVEAADPYRDLRSMLARIRSLAGGVAGDRAPVVLVTSTPDTAADERLALAANLAWVAADVEQRVALIEADLSAPALHRLLTAAPVPGLADAVGSSRRRADGSSDIRHLIQATGRDGVALVTQGSPVRKPSDVLPRLGRFFAAIGQANDLIVIHGPTTDRTDEVVELLAIADQVLVVAAPDVDKDEVRRVGCLVERLAAPVVGVALSARRSRVAPWTAAERPVMVPPPAGNGLVGAPSSPDVPLTASPPSLLEVSAGLDAAAEPVPATSEERAANAPPSVFNQDPAAIDPVWDELGDLLSGPVVAGPPSTPAVPPSQPISVDEALAGTSAEPALGDDDATLRVPSEVMNEIATTVAASNGIEHGAGDPKDSAGAPEHAAGDPTDSAGADDAADDPPLFPPSGAPSPLHEASPPPMPGGTPSGRQPAEPGTVPLDDAGPGSEPVVADSGVADTGPDSVEETIRLPEPLAFGSPPLPPSSLADLPPPAVDQSAETLAESAEPIPTAVDASAETTVADPAEQAESGASVVDVIADATVDEPSEPGSPAMDGVPAADGASLDDEAAVVAPEGDGPAEDSPDDAILLGAAPVVEEASGLDSTDDVVDPTVELQQAAVNGVDGPGITVVAIEPDQAEGEDQPDDEAPSPVGAAEAGPQPPAETEAETDEATAASDESGVDEIEAVPDAAALADEIDVADGADLTVLDDVKFDLLAELEDEDEDEFNPTRR